MERPVEVAVFQRGELALIRTLSPGLERQAALFAAAVTTVVILVAMISTTILVGALGLVVHASTFVAGWLAVALVVGLLAARRASRRARRFVLGAHLDADAFASVDVDLLRRSGGCDEYQLTLVPGMVGTVDHGRSPLPIESLTRNGAVRIPFPPEGQVRVEMGASQIVLGRRAAELPGSCLALFDRVRRAWKGARAFVPFAGGAMPIAAVLSFLGAVPMAQAVGEADMRSSIPASATPAMIEDHVRKAAQQQAETLHQCFDSLPMACQTDGHVDIGLVLAASGQVESFGVVRSSFGRECPVAACMSKVVAGWFFEPMPQEAGLVLPVQVLRSARPLYVPARLGVKDPAPAMPLDSLRDGGLVTGTADMGFAEPSR